MRYSTRQLPFSIRQISPNFFFLVAIFIVGCWAVYTFSSGIAVFLMVAAGWILSLCLHEFGHALAGYLGGDYSVADKGYLTLDPLKYTHPLLSIVLPLLFLVMGGIGLPGGAVYIDLYRLRSRRWESLVAAAGPLGTLASFIVLWIPFLLGWQYGSQHPEFWAAWAMLTYLQLGSFFLNLLPIPGIDGYNIIEYWLPYSVSSAANAIRPFGFFILFALFAYVPFFSQWFFGFVNGIAGVLRLDMFLVSVGFSLFRFWSQ